MKLNHFISQAGITSRRKAAELVKAGRVTVDGKKILQPSFDVEEGQKVAVDKKTIKLQKKKVYILLNKPAGYVTTVSDEKGRKTVIDLVKRKVKERVYPIGRLDLTTTGLLLLTNDGIFAQNLAHPRSEIKKTYNVLLDRPVPGPILTRIEKGITLPDGVVHVDHVRYNAGKPNNLIVVLHSGKYRVIRRLFRYLGYNVKSLDRVKYATLTKKGLKKGQWRFLHKDEVEQLTKTQKGK